MKKLLYQLYSNNKSHMEKMLIFISLIMLTSCATTRNNSDMRAAKVLSKKEISKVLANYDKYVKFQTLEDVKNKNKFKNEITLAWEHQKSPLAKKVNGYKIYFGSAPNKYNGNCLEKIKSPLYVPVSALKEPHRPVIQIKHLTNDICYFAVSSYNEWGESVKSRPILKRINK